MTETCIVSTDSHDSPAASRQQGATTLFGAGAIARDVVAGARSGEFAASIDAIVVDDVHLDSEDTIRTASESKLTPIPYSAMQSSLIAGRASLFVAMGYGRLGTLRRECVDRLARDGWSLCNMLSPFAVVDGLVEPDANVLVMRGAVIQRSASVGRGTICRSRSLVAHDSTVGQYCYLGYGAMVLGNTAVEDHCFIGAGAIVRDGIRIARGSVIGAGAAIMSDTVPNGIYASPDTPLRDVHHLL